MIFYVALLAGRLEAGEAFQNIAFHASFIALCSLLSFPQVLNIANINNISAEKCQPYNICLLSIRKNKIQMVNLCLNEVAYNNSHGCKLQIISSLKGPCEVVLSAYYFIQKKKIPSVPCWSNMKKKKIRV